MTSEDSQYAVQSEQSKQHRAKEVPVLHGLSGHRRDPVPMSLKPGEVIEASTDGEPIVIVGARPSGLPVVLSLDGWRMLRAFELTKLSTASGRVVACGDGVQQPAARLLAGIAYVPSKGVMYANGNAFDLRPQNLVVWPRSRIRRHRELQRTKGGRRA